MRPWGYDKHGEAIWDMAILGALLADHEYLRVGADTVGEAWVSTVWVGVNYNWRNGPPIIFETMIFGGPLDEHCERYATLAEAEAGHARWVETVRLKFAPSQ